MMKPLYTDALLARMEKNLTREKLWVALIGAAGAAALAAILLTSGLNTFTAALSALITAAAFAAIYVRLQKRLLPLQRGLAMMRDFAGRQGETISGTFLGMNDAMSFHSGILMRRVRLDCGEWDRGAKVIQEVNMPACLAAPPWQQGETITLQINRNVVTAWKTEMSWEPQIRLERAAYHVAPLVCALALLVSVLGWMTLSTAVNRLRPSQVLNIAVCSQAHRDYLVEELEQALAPYGIKQVNISYMESTDGEQAAQYLATYGNLEADILLLDDFLFAGAFGNEGYPINEEAGAALEQIAGMPLRFYQNEYGENTGLLLRDPDDSTYSERFPGLRDWLRLDDTQPFVAVINAWTGHGDDGAAQAALECMLSFLLEHQEE